MTTGTCLHSLTVMTTRLNATSRLRNQKRYIVLQLGRTLSRCPSPKCTPHVTHQIPLVLMVVAHMKMFVRLDKVLDQPCLLCVDRFQSLEMFFHVTKIVGNTSIYGVELFHHIGELEKASDLTDQIRDKPTTNLVVGILLDLLSHGLSHHPRVPNHLVLVVSLRIIIRLELNHSSSLNVPFSTNVPYGP